MKNDSTLAKVGHAGEKPSPSTRTWIIAITVLIAAALVGSYILLRSFQPAARSGEVPRNAAIEQRWGIRVTQIGVTADGGLLDFRYLVLDSDKALSMLEDVKTQPQLIAESSGDVLTARVSMTKQHDLRTGETYFVLFYNPQGQVKPGNSLGVKIGDLQLDHVIAK